MVKKQVGAIPYLKVNGKIKLLLVTSRSSGKWIFPKGNIEPDMCYRSVAAMEAYEEAGVTGTVSGKQEKVVAIRRRGSRVDLHLFPMKVQFVLQKWPERQQRKRAFVSPQKAAALLGDKEISRYIRSLAKVI